MALDHFTVTRSSPKYVLGKDGFLKEVPVNVPAFEFNADGSYKGCLIEPSATNLIQYSNDITNSYWQKRNLQTTELTTDPFIKDLPVTRITEDTSTGRHGIESGIIFSQGDEKFKREIFIKPENNTRYVLLFSGMTANSIELGGGGRDVVIFDLSGEGSVANINSSNTEAKIIKYGDWFLLSVFSDTVLTSSSAGQLSLYFSEVSNPDNSTIEYQGDGQKSALVAFAGGFIDSTKTIGSFIYTNGTTATRNADVIVRENAEDLIGQEQGTIYLEGAWLGAPVPFGVTATGFILRSSERSDRGINIGISGADSDLLNVRSRNTAGQSTTEIAYNLGDVLKIAVTYDYNGQAPNTTVTDGAKIYINGVLEDTFDLRVPDTGEELDEIRLLGGVAGSDRSTRLAPQIFKTIALYKRALTEQEVIGLFSEPTYPLLAQSYSYKLI